MQRQVGETMSVQADYAYQANRHEWYSRNTNLNFNPATGANYPFTHFANTPYPLWGDVNQWLSERTRTRTRWIPRSRSASATAGRRRPRIPLAGEWDQDGPAFSGTQRVDLPAGG